MELGKLIETRVHSTLQFSDRTRKIDFSFITENEVKLEIEAQWEKLGLAANEGDINVRSAVFEFVSNFSNLFQT